MNRWIEPELLDTLGELGVGCIAFSPLAQGLLSNRYLNGIPEGSRASRADTLTPDVIAQSIPIDLADLARASAVVKTLLCRQLLLPSLDEPSSCHVDHVRPGRLVTSARSPIPAGASTRELTL